MPLLDSILKVLIDLPESELFHLLLRTAPPLTQLEVGRFLPSIDLDSTVLEQSLIYGRYRLPVRLQMTFQRDHRTLGRKEARALELLKPAYP